MGEIDPESYGEHSKRPPVDMDELYEIMGTDEQFLWECFRDSSDEMGKYLDCIRTAIDREDSDCLVRSAHKLKGSCGIWLPGLPRRLPFGWRKPGIGKSYISLK